MAITLKYGSPGPILQTAFAGGLGHRKNAQQEDLLRIWQQQTQMGFQAQQAAVDRQQRAAFQQQAQNFQADQNAEQNYRADKYRFQQQEFQADQSKLGRDFQASQSAKVLQQQKEHYEAQEYQTKLKGLATGDYELPGSAQTELKKLEEGRVLVQGPGYTDEWRAQFDKDYEAAKRRILGTAVPKMETNPLQYFDPKSKQFTNDPGTAEEGRIPFHRGTGKALENPEAQAQAEAAVKQQAEEKKLREQAAAKQEKEQDAARSLADKLFAERTVGDKPVYPSYADALREAVSRRKQATDFFSGNAPPPQAQEQDTSDAQRILKGLGFNDQQLDLYHKAMQPQQNTAAPSDLGATTGQWGDGSHGEPVTTTPAQQSWYSPEARQKILSNQDQIGLPAPKTPEEAAALGKGASWIAPDGTIRRNP